MADRTTEMEAALRAVIRIAEAAKEPCGMDPEEPAAIRNGKFAGIAHVAAQGLGWMSGPPLASYGVGGMDRGTFSQETPASSGKAKDGSC